MSAVSFGMSWLRIDLGRRWRSLVVLALLIAFATATVLASVAGARRGDSAMDRLLAVTLPHDLVVLPNEPGFDWDKVRALPVVEAVTTFPINTFAVEGIADVNAAGGFPLGDAEAMRTIERPVVLDGRIPDPRRADEVVVTPAFVSSYGLRVGDAVTLRMYKPETIDTAGPSASVAPDGPRVRSTIVGIIRSPWFSDKVGTKGAVIPSAGLFAKYPRSFIGDGSVIPINAIVRLRGGAADVPTFRAELTRITERSDIDVWSGQEAALRLQRTTRFESACLLAFGLAAFLAAMFLIGQAMSRYIAATVADLQTLRPTGLTSRQAILASAGGPAVAALVGASGGIAGAIAASTLMPMGAAGTLEPSPGLDADWLVLAPGWLLVVLVVAGGAAAASWFTLAAARSGRPWSRSMIVQSAMSLGLPTPVVVGTRFALEAGRGRAAVPVRPALVGAVVGVLGVLAAFTFGAGVSDAANNARRFGVTYDQVAPIGFSSQDLVEVGPVLAAWARDRDVVALNDTRVGVAESSTASITIFSFDPVRAPLDVVLNEGSMPKAANEVVLAPESAKATGARVGSVVELAGTHGKQRLTVTGVGFVPQSSHNDYATGAWATVAGYGALFGDDFKFHMVLLALRPGSDAAAVLDRLKSAAGAVVPGGEGVEFEPPTVPDQLALIRDVRVLPVALGGFLALLAIGAVGHALATAVHRRRHDVAVLRALGMTPWQSRAIVVTQATLLAVIGLAVGIPLGLALGRSLWRIVADMTPLAYAPPVAFWAILLAAPLALLVANLLAAWPGHRAARLQVGQILRAE